MQFTPYNKKAFLLPESINSAAMYHAKIFPDGRYIFRMHDSVTGIRLTGELNEEQDFTDAVKKTEKLAKALLDFAAHVDTLRGKLFPEPQIDESQAQKQQKIGRASTFEEFEIANAPNTT